MSESSGAWNWPSGAASEGEFQVSMFKDKEIRKVIHNGEWFFSVVDVVEAISDSGRGRKYWSDLKGKLRKEGSELSDEIGQLKMPGPDGKEYATDAANTETMFRIIQSIPSPNAETFKRWLARTGYERLVEMQNPDIAIKRAIMDYRLAGYSDEWIDTRIKTIQSRNELTAEWEQRGIEGKEYGILTNVISEETFGLGVRQHAEFKGLKKSGNLRDHMTDLELILTMLGEKSTTNIARVRDAQGFFENKTAARDGGKVAGDARKNLETQLGKNIVSKDNHLRGPQNPDKLPEGF